MNIDVDLVERLIAEQFPQWAELPISEVIPNGWDNRTFRLGQKLSVRLPSGESYSHQVEKEQLWLPFLAPNLPLPIPTPHAKGYPTSDYPWQWSIYGWINGKTVSDAPIADLPQFAETLAQFLVALQNVDSKNGPAPGLHNFNRGGNLAVYDEATRTAISMSSSSFDADVLTEIWGVALSSTWDRPPVWVHGDISPGNLLVNDGRVSAVIDFGGAGVGDPACDLTIAWTLFKTESRAAFRTAIALDDDTWARSRGWALWKAVIVLVGLIETNAAEASDSEQIINEILADHRENL